MPQIKSFRRLLYPLLPVAAVAVALIAVPLRAHAASSSNPKPQTLMNVVTTTPSDPQISLLTIPGFGTLYVMPVDTGGSSCTTSGVTVRLVASTALIYVDTRDEYGVYERFNPGEDRWVNGDFVLTAGGVTSSQMASVRVLQRSDPTRSIDCISVAIAQLGP
jgi:hypothetical protein